MLKPSVKIKQLYQIIDIDNDTMRDLEPLLQPVRYMMNSFLRKFLENQIYLSKIKS